MTLPVPLHLLISCSKSTSISTGSSQPTQSIAHPTGTTHRSQSTHPMVTRSRAGIFKPKTFTAIVKPLTVKDALTDPTWRKPMNGEYQALLKITLGN